MSKKTLFERTDGKYNIRLTQDWNKHVVRFEPTELGTEICKDDAIELISVLSRWLSALANER